MRALLAFLVVLTMTAATLDPARAQESSLLEPKPTPVLKPAGISVTKETAQKYYLNCVGNVLSLNELNPIQRDYLCSCVASGLPVSMTESAYDDMTTKMNTTAGQDAFRSFLSNVYMPCALPPLQEILRDSCIMRARNHKDFGATLNERCRCVTDHMTSYTMGMGLAELEYNITRTGQFSEPLDSLSNAINYSEERIKAYKGCFNGLMP